MEVSSIPANVYAAVETPTVSPREAAERRQLIQATKAVNASGVLGDENELVFVLNPRTRQAILRLVDRKTKEVRAQMPPEYVLRLAEDLGQND